MLVLVANNDTEKHDGANVVPDMPISVKSPSRVPRSSHRACSHHGLSRRPPRRALPGVIIRPLQARPSQHRPPSGLPDADQEPLRGRRTSTTRASRTSTDRKRPQVQIANLPPGPGRPGTEHEGAARPRGGATTGAVEPPDVVEGPTRRTAPSSAFLPDRLHAKAARRR